MKPKAVQVTVRRAGRAGFVPLDETGLALRKYDANVFAENQDVLQSINSFDMLTARSLLFSAEKPA